jgi:hypothetical protein
VPDFTFSPSAGRYRDARGRFLSSHQVRSIIDRTLQNHQNAVLTHTELLRSRGISLQEWERRMRQEVKAIHGYSAMLAKGGRSQLTNTDLGRLGAMVKRQYRYLRRFADQIQSGQQPTDGTLVNRTRLYAQAGRGTHEAVRKTEMQRRGFTEVRSVLRPAEHCEVCVEEAAKGWQSPATFTPIGARLCLTNCRCQAEWRNPQTGEVAA